MRSASTDSKTPYNYAHTSTPKAAWSHRYTAAKKKRPTDRSRTRRTDEVPFIAGCSHFTRKNTRFRAPASSPKQRPCNIMQPFQCDLQAQIPKHPITTHTQAHPKQLEATVTLRQKKNPPHRRGTFHRRLQPLYTEKHKVSCSGFLPTTEPLQHHAAIPMRSASTDSKTPYNYAHTSTPKAAWSHRYTAAKKKRPTDRSRTRRTDEVPFIAGCSHFTRKNTRFRAPASSPTHHFPSSPLPIVTTSHRHHLPSSPLPFLTTSLPHHFPSSALPFLTTSLRHHFPSSPLPIVTTSLRHHFPSSPLPIVTTSLRHHFPSSPLPFFTTSLRHHSPSSSLPFVTTSLRHHSPSSSLPFFTASLRHHFPSSPLPFLTTSLRHHFPSSPLPFVTTSLRHHPSLTASYSFVMYCYVIYHPASFQVAEFYLSVTRKYCFPTSFDQRVWNIQNAIYKTGERHESSFLLELLFCFASCTVIPSKTSSKSPLSFVVPAIPWCCFNCLLFGWSRILQTYMKPLQQILRLSIFGYFKLFLNGIVWGKVCKKLSGVVTFFLQINNRFFPVKSSHRILENYEHIIHMCGKNLWITGLVEGKIYRKLWFSRWIPFVSHFFPSKSPHWGLLLWRSSRRSSTRNTRRLAGALPSGFLVIYGDFVNL